MTIPLLPLIALLIKLDSKGPLFFRCERVGKDGRLFKMYKFRTMYDTPVPVGPSLSPADDPRVTRFGRFLRRTKLNELPQLLNVLFGDMTFVGPRPEAPDLAALYPASAQGIFGVKPGLVGPNQILGRNEEDWYPPGVDPQQYYIESILPKKLLVDLAYVQHASPCNDIKYILLGLKETLFKALSWNLILQNTSQIYLLCIDIFCATLSFVFANILRFDGALMPLHLTQFLSLLSLFVLIRIACFFYFGLYSTLIRHLSTTDIIGVFKGVSVSSALFISLTFFFDARTGSRLVFLIDWLFLLFLMASLRFGLRLFYDWLGTRGTQAIGKKTVLIFGAGELGFLTYQFLLAQKRTAYDIVGFLDDDLTKRHKTLCGKKVLGNYCHIEALVKLYKVDEIFLAIANMPSYKMVQVIQACQAAQVPYRVLSHFQDHTLSPAVPAPFLETRSAELFTTPKIELTPHTIRRVLAGKRVLVTGVSGALGVELCRRLLSFAPQSLIILERYESYLTALLGRLQPVFPEATIVPILWSPTGRDPVGEVFRDYAPHIVFHNAMRKYPPFFRFQTDSILRANYLCTFALAKQAAQCGSEYFVLVSSEEADNRGNLIADSLRAAEIGLRQFFAAHQTRLVIARLCDILEHRGGIVASLAEQIANREGITLPHQEAQCSFLSKDAAADFLLETLAQAATLPLAEGIFICHHGAPILLLEIADKLANLKGLQLGRDIPIRFVESPPQAKGCSMQRAPSAHHGLVATAHPSIGLLRETLVPYSPESAKVLEALLNMSEQELDPICWEHHTQTLLRLEH